MNDHRSFRQFPGLTKRDTTRPPGPRGLPVLGSLLEMWRDPLQMLLASSLRFGKHFALMEMQVVLALLAARFRLEPASGHAVDPRPAMDMYPRRPIMMRVLVQPKAYSATAHF